jgi:hypothetical protein
MKLFDIKYEDIIIETILIRYKQKFKLRIVWVCKPFWKACLPFLNIIDDNDKR